MAKPDPSLLVDVVAPKVLEPLKLASEALTAANVRHVVVGGLAVGANGPRFRSKSTASPWTCCLQSQARTSSKRRSPPGTMMEAAPLVYMKLKSPRRGDEVDVIELIKGGSDANRCREYLVAPAFVTAFDECVAQADVEQD